MARRRIAEDPMSRLAIWARRLALFALVALILGTLIVRTGFLEIEPALATIGGALLLAIIAILLGLAALAVIWKDGLGGTGSAIGAIVIGLALIAYPAYLGSKAYRLPMINDITTDSSDPPKLEALARVRPRRGANPVDYPGAFADLQQAAYPDVAPLVLEVPPQIAYETVYAVIAKRKWLIVEARRPLPGRRDGHIEAVARTAIMGFRDDVVVRLRPDGEGTRVDVRSASRYGAFDFGTNAARIVSFLDDVGNAVEALPETRREVEPEPRPTPKPAQEPRRPSARR